MKKLIIFSLILVFVDQLSKFFFTDKKYLIGNFGINYLENTGAAFGLFKGMNIVLIVVSVLVLIFLIYYYKKIKWKLPFILIFAGTLGNLIDRLFFGYVRDFVMIWIWPVFNVADVCSTIGVLLLAYYFYVEDKAYKPKSHRK
ncbi:signal peptidase II [archaeon]|mgnify:CR=1 FL=1|nr:signal peptidase II [archaeon]